jgi:tRNA(Ile)-lysidine synthase
VPVGERWDGRWIARGSGAPGATVRALGPDGLTQAPDWRATGRPRPALLSSPAVWEDKTLVAAPAAGLAGTWSVRLAAEDEAFFASILSH